MKKNKDLAELSLNELYVVKKKSKTILTVIGIFTIIACGVLVFLATKTKNYALLAITCGIFFPLLPIMARLGQIEKEIKKRNGE